MDLHNQLLTTFSQAEITSTLLTGLVDHMATEKINYECTAADDVDTDIEIF